MGFYGTKLSNNLVWHTIEQYINSYIHPIKENLASLFVYPGAYETIVWQFSDICFR